MAMHLSANQFEDVFSPKRLGNWQVPKTYVDPKYKKGGKTHMMANDQGHLLPFASAAVKKPPANAEIKWRTINRPRKDQMVQKPPEIKVEEKEPEPEPKTVHVCIIGSGDEGETVPITAVKCDGSLAQIECVEGSEDRTVVNEAQCISIPCPGIKKRQEIKICSLPYCEPMICRGPEDQEEIAEKPAQSKAPETDIDQKPAPKQPTKEKPKGDSKGKPKGKPQKKGGKKPAAKKAAAKKPGVGKTGKKKPEESKANANKAEEKKPEDSSSKTEENKSELKTAEESGADAMKAEDRKLEDAPLAPQSNQPNKELGPGEMELRICRCPTCCRMYYSKTQEPGKKEGKVVQERAPIRRSADFSKGPPDDVCEEDFVEMREKNLTYVPGDFTEPHHRLPSHKGLEEKLRGSSSGSSSLVEAVKQKCSATHSEHFEHTGECLALNETKQNFQQAKLCHKENLEHHPLPDAIPHLMYRKLQMQGHLHPGLAVGDKTYASAVGWRDGHPSHPTHLTKYRVFRPKTSVLPKKKKEKIERPCTSKYDEKAWRFLVQKNVSPIDLAICWDMVPANPNDEPKRATHIDGSNGSAAPAVFQMVYSTKQPEEEESEEDSPVRRRSSTGSIFCKLENNKCDGINGCDSETSSAVIGRHTMERRKSASPCNHNANERLPACRPLTALPKNHLNHPCHEELQKLYWDDKSNWSKQNAQQQDVHNLKKEITQFQNRMSLRDPNEIMQSNNLFHNNDLYKEREPVKSCHGRFCSKECYRPEHGQMPNHRPCVACELKNMKIDDNARPKTAHKLAFKAGAYHDRYGKFVQVESNPRPEIKMPKLKEPCCRKNYKIDSLNAPFNLLPDKRVDYPDHWRLASVYQRSYKPIGLRKRPLLANVYQ